MNCYLFVFEDGRTFQKSGDNFKRVIYEVGKYIGICEEDGAIFKKSLNGFDDCDIEGIIKLLNCFCFSYKDNIAKVYEVKKQIFESL